MIRVSEMVLPGHPDKFCDQVADAIIAECVKIDADAYGQVEVSVWSDRVWLSGGICTRRPLKKEIRDIVVETGRAIGYGPGNHIDAGRYAVTSTVCRRIGDPTPWSRYVNDQAVIIGWAGYDAKTGFLPPEHYAAHVFRDALVESCRRGPLRGEGPDGKLIVRVREEGDRWQLEHVLVTIQHRASAELMEVCGAVASTLRTAYLDMQARDGRWRASWSEVAVLVNPNGPLIRGGQRRRQRPDGPEAGRRLLRTARSRSEAERCRASTWGTSIGSGAYAARDAAVRAVLSGASECLVRLTYAPNVPEPLDVLYEMMGGGNASPAGFFDHEEMVERYSPAAISRRLAEGRHFFDRALPWNTGGIPGTDFPVAGTAGTTKYE